jgi:ppGpp synthetase/RelA/SpoT-type nucleotidyltranferase
MIPRTVDDKLREEYFDLLPKIQRVKEQLEAEVRYNLVPVLRSLNPHERFEVQSRAKECESAINALRRRQEGSLFENYQPEKYSITQLKDLAGVRVLVFPRGLMKKIDDSLGDFIKNWEADHISGFNETDEIQALKYIGYCTNEKQIISEIQIVPMLTGLFWKVEHEAIYKPKPEFKNIARSLEMRERTQMVLNSLNAFEEKFEELCKNVKLV